MKMLSWKYLLATYFNTAALKAFRCRKTSSTTRNLQHLVTFWFNGNSSLSFLCLLWTNVLGLLQEFTLKPSPAECSLMYINRSRHMQSQLGYQWKREQGNPAELAFNNCPSFFYLFFFYSSINSALMVSLRQTILINVYRVNKEFPALWVGRCLYSLMLEKLHSLCCSSS